MTPIFFPYGFALFFAGMWIAVSYLLSHLSGWRTLAPRYPAAAEPAGDRLIWNSAQVGGVSFRTCLNMTLSSDGFYMVPARLFRLFMPPLLIPWSDVRFAGFKSFLFFEFACFRLGGVNGTVLCVWRKTGERFRPYLGEEARAALAAGLTFEESLIPRSVWIVMAIGAAAGLVGFFVSLARGPR